jgi:uncharacterized protein
MTTVFADTSYWVAVLNPRDELHAKALAISKRLSGARIVTSEMVLIELMNGFSEKGEQLRTIAITAIEAMRRNRLVVMIPQTTDQFEDALWRYRLADDKEWSATDCASFGIMERANIRSALTHDRHFAQAGYEPLLR